MCPYVIQRRICIRFVHRKILHENPPNPPLVCINLKGLAPREHMPLRANKFTGMEYGNKGKGPPALHIYAGKQQ
jgi:hypothetical protein